MTSRASQILPAVSESIPLDEATSVITFKDDQRIMQVYRHMKRLGKEASFDLPTRSVRLKGSDCGPEQCREAIKKYLPDIQDSEFSIK